MNPVKPKKQPKAPETYGGWHFARDFSSGLFGLLNSGRVFPAFGLLILVLMGLLLWRLPEASLVPVIDGFFGVLRSSFALVLCLLLSSNAVWFVLFRKQKRIYENEISRLSNIRSDLLHLGNNQVRIENHRSSEGGQAESYLFPDPGALNLKDTK